jgi:hypothetical protein
LKQIKSVGTEIENQLTLVDPSAVVRVDPESALNRNSGLRNLSPIPAIEPIK